MKRIAIFCDGTWNTPDEEADGKPCATNVVKMALAVSSKSLDKDINGQLIEQISYYHNGVGTEGIFLEKWFDGATGTGISRNIKDAYEFIIKNYQIGDELFLFGFSRGAFTVRSLAGLIRNCGVLKVQNIEMIRDAYKMYRSTKPDYHPNEKEAVLFRKSYSVEDLTPIHFIGVFDTVGALGNPLLVKNLLGTNEFHDTNLSSQIRNAYHALAIDEKRIKFDATLWCKKDKNTTQNFQQMWFCGVHSDVGGGYPETALSDISLIWMIEKAENCNLHFDSVSNPTPKPDPLGKMNESYKGFYTLYKENYRIIGRTCTDNGTTNEEIHPSVWIRIERDPSYRPKNLIDYCKRNHIPIP